MEKNFGEIWKTGTTWEKVKKTSQNKKKMNEIVYKQHFHIIS